MKIKNIVITLFSILILTVSGLSAEEAKYPEEQSHIGTVVLIKDTAKYIYMKLDENGKEVWIAAQDLKVAVGDKVAYTGGVLMKDFKSKALNMTFDYILLISWIRVLNEDSLKSDQSITDDDQQKQLPVMKKIVSAPVRGEIKKAEGGMSIEEIFSERDKFRGKEVVLRGRAMKIINNILGMTWVTLQDGTGMAPDNKIIAVTMESVNLGDVLTARGILQTNVNIGQGGILQTNVNIGQGYSYKVLIDEVKFTK